MHVLKAGPAPWGFACWVALLGCALAAGCHPTVPEGLYACDDDAGCPRGWSCVMTDEGGRCYRSSEHTAGTSSGSGGGGGADAGSFAGSGVTDGAAPNGMDASHVGAVDSSVLDGGVIDAAVGDGGLDESFVVGTLGLPCSQSGAYGCAGHAQKGQLICAAGVWQHGGTCAGADNCDSRAGIRAGSCQPIVPECADREAGEVFCRGGNPSTCGLDLVSVHVLETCEGQACVDGQCAGVCLPGSARCDGNAPQACDAMGMWTSGSSCSVLCASGQCSAVEEIGAGFQHSCARLTDGTVRCWGANNLGQLGTMNPSNTPSQVSNLRHVVELAVGRAHNCVRVSDGSISCWGANVYGQLGTDTSGQPSLEPLTVMGLSNVAQLTAGGAHTCALLQDRSVRCWGFNDMGQLGNGDDVSSAVPVAVTNLQNAIQVVAGDFHACALLDGGTVSCWGYNSLGQLGDGTRVDRATPTVVSGLSNVTQLALGVEHTCARLGDGTVRCWGDNRQGQTGGEASFQPVTSPTVVPSLTNAVQLAAGAFSTCAQLTNGTARCWGSNSSGQLGDGTTTSPSPSSVTVLGVENITQLAAGSAHACARTASGTAYCWGRNNGGQLGTGSEAEHDPTPSSVVWHDPR